MSQKWKKVAISEVAEVVTGTTPPTADASNYGGDIPFVSPGDLGVQKYVFSAVKKLSLKGATKARLIPPGSTLFTCIGSTIGKIGIAGNILTTNQQINAAIPKNISAEFLYYALSNIAERIKRIAGVQAVPIINKTEFENQLFYNPVHYDVQEKIAFLLSTWDQAIEKTERLIAVKEKRFLWLSGGYLFGGNTPNAKASKKTKWFSVPDHWKIVKIGSIAKEVTETNDAGENIPVLSCTKYDGLVDSLTYFDKQVFSMDTSNYKVVSRGQFAYATNHIEEGSIGYQNLYSKGLVSPMYTAFKTDAIIDDSYLYKVLKTETYKHIFRVSTSASVDRRGSLRWNEFAKLPIPLPPVAEQQKISRDLNTVRQKIDLLKKQAKAYRQQKRGLMQKLLTGKWHVTIDEKEG